MTHRPCRLANELLQLEVWPERGGGVAGLDWCARDEPIALLRRCVAVAEDTGAFDANRLACYPLVPWSNRISAGGFTYQDQRVALTCNRHDDPFPIHGSGWQRAWSVRSHDAGSLELELDEHTADAFSYQARQRFILHGRTLEISLAVTNTGDHALPFGLGLHPFIPRHGGVLLQAPCNAVWMNDGRSPLPTHRAPLPADWDFADARMLPPTELNHAFVGWNGQATVRWPGLGLNMQLDADVDTYLLYTPVDGDFFCFEPVDHPIDAVHLPGGPLAHGMTALAPGESLHRRFRFTVQDERQDERMDGHPIEEIEA